MGKLTDAVERLVFGATTAERVDMMTELAARRAEARLIAALDRAFDRAFDGAIADTFGDAQQSEKASDSDV